MLSFSFFKQFPIYLTYIIFPLIYISNYNFALGLSRNYIDIVFIFASLFLFVFSFYQKYVTKKISRELLVFLIIILVLISFNLIHFLLSDNKTITLPLLMDLKIIFYFVFSVLWLDFFGVMKKEEFTRPGVWLAILVMASVVIESLSQGEISRGHGSGEVNYDACLLIISFVCTAFSNTIKKISLFIITLGLLATLSRTMLVIFIIVIFSNFKISIYRKLILSFISVFLFTASFSMRDLELDFSKIDRVYMWKVAHEEFQTKPNFWGNAPGQAVDVVVPNNLLFLWERQSTSAGVSEIYPFNFHAMWLRFYFNFGLIFTTSILLFFIYKSIYAKTRLEKSLSIILILQGITMGALYASNVSIPFFLAYLSFYSKKSSS